MSSSLFSLPEPITQATQKLWQEQISQVGRFAAETAKLEVELAGRAKTNIEESAKLMRHSFEYFFAVSETVRNATLAAWKDAASFGSGKAAE